MKNKVNKILDALKNKDYFYVKSEIKYLTIFEKRKLRALANQLGISHNCLKDSYIEEKIKIHNNFKKTQLVVDLYDWKGNKIEKEIK